MARPGFNPGSGPSENFSISRFAQPGLEPAARSGPILMSLACRLRSERPGFDSGFGSTAFRGIGRCRLRATETQQATPLNYADGRDRRRREAAATAPRAWSRKCPGEPTLKCGDKGYFSQQTVSRSAITRVIYQRASGNAAPSFFSRNPGILWVAPWESRLCGSSATTGIPGVVSTNKQTNKLVVRPPKNTLKFAPVQKKGSG